MATDAEIRARGIKYLPQQKYLQNPYELPVEEEVTESFGIPNTNAFTNSGGNDFNSAGNAFGYGSPVNEVNVRTFNPQSNDPTGSVASAQEEYNQLGDIKDKSIYSNYADINNQIMDNRQNYQANYNSPYEDSMELPNRSNLDKGMLRRFTDKIGGAAKFAGGLLPFPLNLATKFLPQGDDNGPGGGTYGIAGLSDDKKAAYNALAGQGYLFGGQQGFKTLTGKNFQATNYVPNQLEMYEKLKDEEELTGFQKKQLQEASAVYKATQKQNKDTADAKAAADAQAAAATTGGGGQGIDISGAGTIRSSDNNFQGDSGPTTQQESDYGYGSDFGFAKGGRAGYFFGGRVNFKDGGLASIL